MNRTSLIPDKLSLHAQTEPGGQGIVRVRAGRGHTQRPSGRILATVTRGPEGQPHRRSHWETLPGSGKDEDGNDLAPVAVHRTQQAAMATALNVGLAALLAELSPQG